MYERSGSQFIRNTTRIQSRGRESAALDESRSVMTFLTNLGVSYKNIRVVLEGLQCNGCTKQTLF